MIIVQLQGGLANQMVLYAAGRALADKHHTQLKLDCSALDRDELRRYQLCHLNISATMATIDEITAITGISSHRWVAKLQKKLHKTFPVLSPIYDEPTVGYDPTFWNLKDNCYIRGNFISRRYFEPIAPILEEEFRITSPLSDTTIGLAQKAEREASVSIHVRRGDYASNIHTRDFHGLLDITYYQDAMERVESMVDDPVYYVFSDDIPWVKGQLSFRKPVTFVDHVTPENGYEDMYLMTRCRHNIIANSGFSFWAAWLNKHPDKHVIAPRQWFANKVYNGIFDLLPPEWERL